MTSGGGFEGPTILRAESFISFLEGVGEERRRTTCILLQYLLPLSEFSDQALMSSYRLDKADRGAHIL